MRAPAKLHVSRGTPSSHCANATTPHWSPSSIPALVHILIAACTCTFFVGCWSKPSTSSSSPAAAEEAQAKAHARAIESIGARYWYDPSTGKYRPPNVFPDPDHPLRKNGTVAGPTAAAAPWRPFGNGLRLPSGDFFAYAAIVVLGLALLAVAIALTAVSLGGWRPLRKNVERAKEVEIDPSRVSDLPFEAQAEMHDPLAYAKHLVAHGNYNEAILFLYGYMLLALDRAGKIVLHRGKTNRMYLQDLNDERELRRYLVPAMLAFEDVFFGRHDIQPERFQKIWAQLDSFHRALAPAIAELAATDRMTAS